MTASAAALPTHLFKASDSLFVIVVLGDEVFEFWELSPAFDGLESLKISIEENVHAPR